MEPGECVIVYWSDRRWTARRLVGGALAPVFGAGGEEEVALSEQFVNEATDGVSFTEGRSKRPRLEAPKPFDVDIERPLIEAFEATLLAPGEQLDRLTINSLLRLKKSERDQQIEYHRIECEKLRVAYEDREINKEAADAEKRIAELASPISTDLTSPNAQQISTAYIPYIASREGTNETKMALFESTVKSIVDTVCPGMANQYNDRPDPRVVHHVMHFQALFWWGKSIMRNYLLNARLPEVRAEADAWYEGFAVLVMAIVKADTAFNCQNVYRATFAVTKQPKYTAGTTLFAHFNQVKEFLSATVVLALYHHTKDHAVAKAAAGTTHAPVQQARKNIAHNLSAAANATGPPKKEGQ